MEERRRTRSQGPPTPAENNELIQWDPVQNTVRIERGRTETGRLTRQMNIVNNAKENRTENNEISQEQHSNELDHEQRTAYTPTTSEIPPKEQPLENTGLQTGEIPPTEQRPGNIGSQPGEISPEKQRLEDPGVQLGEIPPKQQNGHPNSTSPKLGEIPQQKVHQPKANELTITHPNGEVDREESPRMDTAEHYLDDNFSDVMRSLAIGSNVSSLFNTTAFNTTNNEHCLVVTQNKFWSTLETLNPIGLMTLLQRCNVKLLFLGQLRFGTLNWNPPPQTESAKNSCFKL